MESVTNKTVAKAILESIDGCASIADLSKLLASQPKHTNGVAFRVVRHCETFRWYDETLKNLSNAGRFVKNVAELYV